MRKPIIGVMGGAEVSAAVARDAYELGALIARKGWVLLNGGRACGVMEASAKGAKEAGGLTVGVLPDDTTEHVSPSIDIPIVTGMGAARNVINVLSSDVVIACPGSGGTLSEVALALKAGRTVILLGIEVGAALAEYRASGQLEDAEDPRDAIEKVQATLRNRGF
jgi:uncharacterized protein (TIGR00725 family)